MGESSFAIKIAALLSQGSTINVLSQFTDNRNYTEVYNNSWDLVPIIAGYLTSKCESDNREVFKCCQKLIDNVAELSKPEEVLLQFIEEIETATDDTKLLCLLKPTEKILLRLPEKRIASLGWCFNAILSYIQKIEPPEDLDLTGDERILLDSNDDVNRISNIYTEVLSFFEMFVNELSNAKLANIQERKHVVAKFLIDLLGQPVAYCDITMYKNVTPRLRWHADNIMDKFKRIVLDPFVFLEMRDNGHDADLRKPQDLSLGVFYYLLLCENVVAESIPRVYNPVYIFQNCLKIVNVLLVQKHQFAIEKGIDLADSLIKYFTRKQLSYLLLDSDCHSTFCKYLSNVIIYNSIFEIRQKALNVFRSYLWSFEDQGRYLILRNFFPSLTHSSLKGFIITQFKEMITLEISGSVSPPYYSGSQLFNLLEMFTHLKDRETTDMVEESDQIIASLNLIRYLVLADKTGITQIDWYLGILKENFLSQIRFGINMSREHYVLKMKQMHEEKTGEYPKMSVNVSGKELLEMSDTNKIDVMQLALTTLDMIDSLLSRVEVCIAERDTCLSRTTFRKQSTNDKNNYDEEIREKILAASLPHVVELGWSRKALGAGACSLGYPGIIHGMFPGGGADLLHYFQKCSNMKLVDILKELEKSQKDLSMPPAIFVENALQSRLKMIIPYLSRWPQAIAIMSLPPNVPNALATLLTAVDDICYYAGDRSVDFNWYARRLGVAGVYKATELYLIQDKSQEYEATWQFLHRRLGEAVQIHEVLCQSNLTSSGPKDAVTSAFVTARNILGLNWTR